MKLNARYYKKSIERFLESIGNDKIAIVTGNIGTSVDNVNLVWPYEGKKEVRNILDAVEVIIAKGNYAWFAIETADPYTSIQASTERYGVWEALIKY